MKFLLRAIENFFENLKYLNNPIEFLKKFFRLWKTLMNSSGGLPPAGGGSAILASSMVTIQAVVAMVTVPVAMVTSLVAMEI